MARYRIEGNTEKVLDLYHKKDPIVNMWRSVLTIGIEDLLKRKEIQSMSNRKKISVEELWFYHKDFDLVCEYAKLDPSIVRLRVFNAIRKIRKNYEQRNLSKMSRKWFYKSEGINREPNRYSTTMYDV
jgi:activator of HSP90 ATPase